MDAKMVKSRPLERTWFSDEFSSGELSSDEFSFWFLNSVQNIFWLQMNSVWMNLVQMNSVVWLRVNSVSSDESSADKVNVRLRVNPGRMNSLRVNSDADEFCSEEFSRCHLSRFFWVQDLLGSSSQLASGSIERSALQPEFAAMASKKGQYAHMSDESLDQAEEKLQEMHREAMQNTLDAYARNPILNKLLDMPGEAVLASGSKFGFREKSIMEEHKKKRRKSQGQLNLIRKEKRQRAGLEYWLNEDEEATAMAHSGSQVQRDWYKTQTRGPHEWPEEMRKLARERAGLATGSIGSGSSSSAAGSSATASTAFSCHIYIDTATPQDQPATGGFSFEIQGPEPGAEGEQPAIGGSTPEVQRKPKQPLKSSPRKSRSPRRKGGKVDKGAFKGGKEGQDSSGPTMAKGKGGMGKQPATGGSTSEVQRKPKRPLRTPSRSPPRRTGGKVGKGGTEGQDSSGPTMAKGKGKGGKGKQPAIGGKSKQPATGSKSRRVHEAQVGTGAASTQAHSQGSKGGKGEQQPIIGKRATGEKSV